MRNADVIGPLFVSIGDQEKLVRFLELNPAVPVDRMFVDGYNFTAYKDAGYGKIGDSNITMEDVKLPAPGLDGFGGWMKYLTNVIQLSPIDKSKETKGIPEGVFRLGGTMVVDGDRVLYRWNDKYPGDHPDLEDVMKVVEAV